MKIQAQVVVSNRDLCSHSLKGPKAVHSCLAIGAKYDEAFLFLSTAQNRTGQKYSLKKTNVKELHSKFIREGKATICFHQPPHNICLSKCDPSNLHKFLSLLCKVQDADEGTLAKLPLSSLDTPVASAVAKPKTKLVVTNKSDYPITTSFPHTLEVLQALNINLRRFDTRILRLKHLSVLDLSDNAIPEIPSAIHQLANLRELHMGGNQIKELSMEFCSGSLSKTLTLLDIRRNLLPRLPANLHHLRALVTLRLDDNQIERLPFGIGQMHSLRFLTAAGNQLTSLPDGVRLLSLDEIDISRNPFVDRGKSGSVLFSRLEFPSLLDLCLTACLRFGMRPTSEDVPLSILGVLDSHVKCRCGNPCFSSKAALLSICALSHMARTTNGPPDVPLELMMCSQKCLDRYKCNPCAL